jgi:hypothetical protein
VKTLTNGNGLHPLRWKTWTETIHVEREPNGLTKMTRNGEVRRIDLMALSPTELRDIWFLQGTAPRAAAEYVWKKAK